MRIIEEIEFNDEQYEYYYIEFIVHGLKLVIIIMLVILIMYIYSLFKKRKGKIKNYKVNSIGKNRRFNKRNYVGEDLSSAHISNTLQINLKNLKETNDVFYETLVSPKSGKLTNLSCKSTSSLSRKEDSILDCNRFKLKITEKRWASFEWEKEVECGECGVKRSFSCFNLLELRLNECHNKNNTIKTYQRGKAENEHIEKLDSKNSFENDEEEDNNLGVWKCYKASETITIKEKMKNNDNSSNKTVADLGRILKSKSNYVIKSDYKNEVNFRINCVNSAVKLCGPRENFSRKELDFLQEMTRSYNKNINENISKIISCESDCEFYNEIYSIINKSVSNTSTKEENMLKIDPQNMQRFIKNSNVQFLSDTGRFQKDFENVTYLGSGRYGTVFKAKHKIDGTVYAIKVLKLNVKEDDDLMKFKGTKHFNLMSNISHDCVVRYKTCWFELDKDLQEEINLHLKIIRKSSCVNKEDFNESVIKKVTKSNVKEKENDEFKNKDEKNVIIDWDIEDNDEEDESSLADIIRPELNKENDDKIKQSAEKIGIFPQENKCLIISDNSNEASYRANSEPATYKKDTDYKNDDFFYDFPHLNLDLPNKESSDFMSSSPTSLERSGKSGQRKRSENKEANFPVYFYTQIEFINGCPLSFLLENRREKLSDEVVMFIFRQICYGVREIHKENIVHKDIKPSNIYLLPKYKIKIGDIGFRSNKNKYFTNNKESLQYQSPEQVNFSYKITGKSDIFSLGAILLDLCLIFPSSKEKEENFNFLKLNKLLSESKLIKERRYEIVDLIKNLTKISPDLRPNIEEICGMFEGFGGKNEEEFDDE